MLSICETLLWLEDLLAWTFMLLSIPCIYCLINESLKHGLENSGLAMDVAMPSKRLARYNERMKSWKCSLFVPTLIIQSKLRKPDMLPLYAWTAFSQQCSCWLNRTVHSRNNGLRRLATYLYSYCISSELKNIKSDSEFHKNNHKVVTGIIFCFTTGSCANELCLRLSGRQVRSIAWNFQRSV